MKIGIIAAMPVEIDLLLENCTVERQENHFDRTVHIAKFGENELFIGVSGIGKTNAASFTQLLVDKYEIEIVMNTGIAGSLVPWLDTLSIVIANNLFHHDFPDKILEGTYPGLKKFPTDVDLCRLALDSIPDGTRVEIEGIASGDDFINSSEKKLNIAKKTSALACDMESAAIAQVAYACGIKTLIIRAISDGADENAEATYENFEEAAAKLSVQVLLGVLRKM